MTNYAGLLLTNGSEQNIIVHTAIWAYTPSAMVLTPNSPVGFVLSLPNIPSPPGYPTPPTYVPNTNWPILGIPTLGLSFPSGLGIGGL